MVVSLKLWFEILNNFFQLKEKKNICFIALREFIKRISWAFITSFVQEVNFINILILSPTAN